MSNSEEIMDQVDELRASNTLELISEYRAMSTSYAYALELGERFYLAEDFRTVQLENGNLQITMVNAWVGDPGRQPGGRFLEEAIVYAPANQLVAIENVKQDDKKFDIESL